LKKNLKRNIVMVAVLLFVGAAVYLNWSYNSRMGEADPAMAAAEDAAAAAAENGYLSASAEDELSGSVGAYFATARLTRQQSRDEALSLLETAAAAETASQEIIDSAMQSISVMATWSMQESQIENLLLAKDFDDCVVYMSGEGITVAVPAPADGLSEAAVARITDTITSETDYPASQIKIIEVREGTGE
jgi:stage III sporulation protein AH